MAEGRLSAFIGASTWWDPRRPSRRGRWLAAVIACGVGRLSSHRHGAMLRDMRGDRRASIDVSVPGPGRRGHGDHAPRDGIVPPRRHHRHRRDPRDLPERTLLDLAEVVTPHQLQRAYEQAEKLRILDFAKLRALVERSNGRRGLKHLLPLLEYDPTPATDAWSELERLFHDLVRGNGLPPYQRNVVVDGDPSPVDAYWPRHGSSSSSRATRTTPAGRSSSATTPSGYG